MTIFNKWILNKLKYSSNNINMCVNIFKYNIKKLSVVLVNNSSM